MALPSDFVERAMAYIQHQAAKTNEAIADMVARNHARLLGVLDGHDEAFASRSPAEGEWSLRELVRHSIDSVQIVDDIIQALGAGRTPARSAPAAATLIADTGQPYAVLIAGLRQVNASVLKTIAAMPGDADLGAKSLHAFLGPLNMREWAVLLRVHDEDHIQHAGKIIAALRA